MRNLNNTKFDVLLTDDSFTQYHEICKGLSSGFDTTDFRFKDFPKRYLEDNINILNYVGERCLKTELKDILKSLILVYLDKKINSLLDFKQFNKIIVNGFTDVKNHLENAELNGIDMRSIYSEGIFYDPDSLKREKEAWMYAIEELISSISKIQPSVEIINSRKSDIQVDVEVAALAMSKKNKKKQKQPTKVTISVDYNDVISETEFKNNLNIFKYTEISDFIIKNKVNHFVFIDFEDKTNLQFLAIDNDNNLYLAEYAECKFRIVSSTVNKQSA